VYICICLCDRKSMFSQECTPGEGGTERSLCGCLLRSVRYAELPVKVTKVYKNALPRWFAYTAPRLQDT
jgi:hypothetical protein